MSHSKDTPNSMHFAAENRHVDVIKALNELRDSIWKINCFREIPIDIATENGHNGCNQDIEGIERRWFRVRTNSETHQCAMRESTGIEGIKAMRDVSEICLPQSRNTYKLMDFNCLLFDRKCGLSRSAAEVGNKPA